MNAATIPFGNGDFTVVTANQTLRAASPVAQAGGAGFTPAGASQPFPEALVALAAEHVASLRMAPTFNGLLDLIEQAERERDHKLGADDIAGHMLDRLVDLRIEAEGLIQRAAEAAAVAEAEQLDEQFADMSADDLATELKHIRPSQRAALIWMQARAIADACAMGLALGFRPNPEGEA